MMIHAEVEKALRQSRAYLARLRLEKKLGHSRGRPALIDEKYLEIYIARVKQRRVARPKELRECSRSKKQGETFNYVPAGAAPGPFNLLTIAEVAIKFGRSLRQIRYLCSHGSIPYIPGEPPLIDEVDIVKYFERKRAAKLARTPPTPGTPEFKALQDEKAREQERRRLRRIVVQREVERILEARAARIADGTFKLSVARRPTAKVALKPINRDPSNSRRLSANHRHRRPD
jgi:hypothetical protein